VYHRPVSSPGGDPLVTVVIPTFDRLPLLREALASVAAQSYPHWEVVIVDDGSSDDTVAAIRALADPRVRVLERPHRGHIGSVRNAGVATARGELIAFLDADDLWHAAKLERQVAAMRRSGAAWSYTVFEMMDARQQPIPMQAGVCRPLSGWIVRDMIEDRTGVMISTVVVTRALFDAVGGFSENPRLTHRGDFELALRLAVTAEVCAVPDTLTRVREHQGRTTATLSRPFERTALVFDGFLALTLPADVRRSARRGRARQLVHAAAQRKRGGEYGPAARLLIRAAVDRALAAWPMTSRR
jgi:glycosyltransferase involved in cell wall biosynthesis